MPMRIHDHTDPATKRRGQHRQPPCDSPLATLAAPPSFLQRTAASPVRLPRRPFPAPLPVPLSPVFSTLACHRVTAHSKGLTQNLTLSFQHLHKTRGESAPAASSFYFLPSSIVATKKRPYLFTTQRVPRSFRHHRGYPTHSPLPAPSRTHQPLSTGRGQHWSLVAGRWPLILGSGRRSLLPGHFSFDSALRTDYRFSRVGTPGPTHHSHANPLLWNQPCLSN